MLLRAARLNSLSLARTASARPFSTFSTTPERLPQRRNVPEHLRHFHRHIQHGNLKEALDTVLGLYEFGMEIDAFPFTLLMKEYVSEGKPELAKKMWEQMLALKIKPHPYSYEIMVDVLKRLGDNHTAASLSDEHQKIVAREEEELLKHRI